MLEYDWNRIHFTRTSVKPFKFQNFRIAIFMKSTYF